eukprot:tig00000553_g2099.t1
MARNQEKAQSMLNRYIQAKLDKYDDVRKRPKIAAEVDNLFEAERWRQEIVKEISQKIAEIQNTGLPEHRLRDLNDHINKLMREKWHWEKRIRDLGGADHQAVANKMANAEAVENSDFVQALSSAGGYKYFGAARNLPGVKELFEAQKAERAKRTRMEMWRNVDAEYYGYHDDDETALEKAEAEAEKAAVAKADEQWRAEREKAAKKHKGSSLAAAAAEAAAAAVEDDTDFDPEASELGLVSEFKAHVELPDQSEIEKKILEKRKKELLKQLEQQDNSG